ncbi:Alpha/beta hydrolase fold-1 [Microdochium trichocladiopsis]|uniref:Alpha/beta hydrolase fold-1 n=1 Tax=Microdochium trichocladiopsis TaxID=1682393 RepID=A0A9P9BTA3_9PEZI|nr:Alpha/beta hydrolase fold-1 [Microdochium trichocladiopsis]KAH7029636.1 Alpha/beta hydrolase fold-1 [Microdochium trichocladiopsis]
MAAASPKPVVLLVHGAWHSPVHYNLLIKALQAGGHTVVAPQNASAGAGDSGVGKGIPDDIARIDEVAGPHIEAGRDIILVAHSYGGVPGTTYLKGRTAHERQARGLAGGFVAALYLTSFPGSVPKPNPEAPQPAMRIFDIDAKRSIAVLKRAAIGPLFYADVPGDDEPNKSRRETLFDLLSGQSLLTFTGETTVDVRELTMRKTYVVCTCDELLLPAAQHEMAEHIDARIVEIDAGHSPFLVTRHVQRIVEEVAMAAGCD